MTPHELQPMLEAFGAISANMAALVSLYLYGVFYPCGGEKRGNLKSLGFLE